MTASEPYLFYVKDLPALPTLTAVGHDVRHALWHAPRLPARPPRTRLPKSFLAFSILRRVFRASPFGIATVQDNTGNLVHQQAVTRKDFRYPFMGPTDVMIGSLWTDPDWRGRGIAAATLARTLAALQPSEKSLAWYVVAPDNTASIRVAQRNGFRLAGTGQRRSRWGIRLLGRFEVSTDRSELSALTEHAGMLMPPEQIAMARTRYDLAARRAVGTDVLEIGCGSGFGLSYLNKVARRAVGGDLSERNLRLARARDPDLTLTKLDAHALPFRAQTFDIITLFEVIYYLANPRAALIECGRVLRQGGILLICLPNPERPGFHRSPLSHRYFSAADLHRVLGESGFDAEICGAFRSSAHGIRALVLQLATQLANKLRLVPRTLGGRQWLKRVFFGRLDAFTGLQGVPNDATGKLEPIHSSGDVPCRNFKTLYAVARLQ